MSDESNRESRPDPTPPNVQPVSPTDGQTGISTNPTVTATFDKDMGAATIQNNFELRDASNNVVPATVTYEEGSRTARLTPNSPIDNSKTYTATLKGGAEGVKDAEGNALAQAMSWSFTTAAPTPTPTSPPYNLYFATVCVLVGAAAYVLTMVIFRSLIKAPEDVAIVSGSLGVLFTLIGTVAGTYFGIKRSSDTEDKGRAAESDANERTQETYDKARKASLMVNPKDPEVDVRDLL